MSSISGPGIQRALSPLNVSEKRLWLLVSGIALAAGVYFRFRGFSVWPLATDEYFIYRSMVFVSETGLPEFPCGGYYMRGLLYQYITAPLLMMGFSPEGSIRFVSIISNLAMLPAACLLGYRVGGFRIAAAVLTILSLSTWEVELARFGRMYAPFQAIFLWYAYHLYMLVVTGDRRRWRWLISLSIAAPLVWEGGITILAANFLPILMRRSLWRPIHVASAALIIISSVIFLETDFRTLGPDSASPPSLTEPINEDVMAPPLPSADLGQVSLGQAADIGDALLAGATNSIASEGLSLASGVVDSVLHIGLSSLLAAHLSIAQFVEPLGVSGFMGAELATIPILGFVFAVLVLILIVGFVRVLPGYKSDGQGIATLAFVAVSVLLNQLFLAVLILTGASLLEWFRLRDVLSARYRSIILPLLGIAGIWVCVALLVQSGADTDAGVKAIIKSLLPLINFPDLINAFLYIWLVSMPFMTVMLLVGTGMMLLNCLFKPSDDNAGLRILGALLLLCLSIIGVAPLTYIETRYSFHLYPLLMLLGFAGFVFPPFARGASTKFLARWAPPTFLGLFLLSSDFSLAHMMKIDTYKANFRVDYSETRAQHYYSRFDFESPAEFVNQRADTSDNVVTSSEVVTHYLKIDSSVYLHSTDERYPLQACDFGNMERWTGLPLLDSTDDIMRQVESRPGSQSWLIVDHYALNSTLPHDNLIEEGGYKLEFMSPDEKFRVYSR